MQDYSKSRWAVGPGPGGTLGILVEEAPGLVALELGLRPGQDGYLALREMADWLVTCHNAYLKDATVPSESGEAPTAEALGSVWRLGVTGTYESAILAKDGTAVCVLDSHNSIPESVSHAALMLLGGHNALLPPAQGASE